MSSSAGVDLRRGRPLPAIGTTEAKLQQRKLDALKRGVHRISDTSNLIFGIHLIGVGRAGAKVIERFLRDAPSDLLGMPGSRFTALAIDVGDEDLCGVRNLADRFDARKSQVETIALDVPGQEDLDEALSHYVDFLKLEYPMYHPNPDSTAWLPPVPVARDEHGSMPRAIAKAIYSHAFYAGDRPMQQALKRFAGSVEATGGDSLVCIVFGLGGGTGSGVAMDMARHLSAGIFGRRVLVNGIGIQPHRNEMAAQAAQIHTVLAELDVLCDEGKNQGVTLSCGDLYRNPFTAGFIVVPQPPNVDIEAAHDIVDRELATLFSERRGANLWEALRLLNWVAAPSTQHSAARTPWGARWIHMFGFGSDAVSPDDAEIRKGLGLLSEYEPEFIELRAASTTDAAVPGAWAAALDASLRPEVSTQVVTGGRKGSVQFLLPRMARVDLTLSKVARTAYDALPIDHRHAMHALLLEQGLLLCEPSTRLEGMAGANIGEGGQWIAVPMHLLHGESD